MAHARLEVGPSPVPGYFAWGLLGALALIAVGMGTFRILRPPRERPATALPDPTQ